MAIVNYAFARGIDYSSIVATSEKVAWTVDEIFGERRFDATKPLVPDSWVGTQHLTFLSADEQRTLNHLRAFSYIHLFGNYEEFIPIHLMGLAGQDWHTERAPLRALLRFGEEELKHQQLFLRAEAVLEASCGHPFGRHFDKDRLIAFTAAMLSYPPLPRSLILLALEWGSQRHYVDSVRDQRADSGSCDPLYVDILKYHWIEENQHTKTGVLEIAQVAHALGADQISEAFDQFQGIAGLVDKTFVGQVDQEVSTFRTVTGRTLDEAEATALRGSLYQSMRKIWAEVAMTHPNFKRVAMELSKEGAAKLGIV